MPPRVRPPRPAYGPPTLTPARVSVASSRDGAGGSEWGGKELRGWRRTMGTPGAYDCVPWGKVGGRRAQAALPTLAPNNGAGDVAVHESDEPMTIHMTEHGCSIDGTITMKNSVRGSATFCSSPYAGWLRRAVGGIVLYLRGSYVRGVPVSTGSGLSGKCHDYTVWPP